MLFFLYIASFSHLLPHLTIFYLYVCLSIYLSAIWPPSNCPQVQREAKRAAKGSAGDLGYTGLSPTGDTSRSSTTIMTHPSYRPLTLKLLSADIDTDTNTLLIFLINYTPPIYVLLPGLHELALLQHIAYCASSSTNSPGLARGSASGQGLGLAVPLAVASVSVTAETPSQDRRLVSLQPLSTARPSALATTAGGHFGYQVSEHPRLFFSLSEYTLLSNPYQPNLSCPRSIICSHCSMILLCSALLC